MKVCILKQQKTWKTAIRNIKIRNPPLQPKLCVSRNSSRNLNIRINSILLYFYFLYKNHPDLVSFHTSPLDIHAPQLENHCRRKGQHEVHGFKLGVTLGPSVLKLNKQHHFAPPPKKDPEWTHNCMFAEASAQLHQQFMLRCFSDVNFL